MKMHAIKIDSTYNPKSFEQRIYELWENSGAFQPYGNGEPFVIILPPPNITGVLHLGHGLQVCLQDILVRYYRMCGRRTVWIPGTDHAGIATQNIIEKRLHEAGTNKEAIGRDAFMKLLWDTTQEHHVIITQQIRQTGASVDWTREAFTLDEGPSTAVYTAFKILYEKKLIYRGTYLINWSVDEQTALSDDEVIHKEIQGNLYHITYNICDTQESILIATTRPETLFGDVALAVHPDDERYKHLIGKKVHIPLCDRVIPIIADTYVSMEFGSGVVKITPGHDFNDYTIGIRHHLKPINIMNPDGTLNEHVSHEFQGLSIKEARKQVIIALKKLQYMDKITPHTYMVAHAERSGSIIEPYLSTQWFIHMKPMAEYALHAWQNNSVRFYPQKWENTYKHWLHNIRDWCISRQLWWGHRIPIWYYEDKNGVQHEILSQTRPSHDPNTGISLENYMVWQDPDVLDTWFSSWLWPFSTLGWPEKTNDMQLYYPGSTLITGYDILFFWVSRMIMAGLEFHNTVPFHDIYLTGLIRDMQGRKFSKSLGNGIDPLEIIDTYGADALKFTFAFLATQGQDINLDQKQFSLGNRFANKIWNASRYLLGAVDGAYYIDPIHIISDNTILTHSDKWILHRINECAITMHEAFISYRFNDASEAIYSFIWNDFCDWYIEISKLQLYSNNIDEKSTIASLLLYVLEQALKFVHPFLPALSEEIYQLLQKSCGIVESPSIQSGLLMCSSFPQYEAYRHHPQAVMEFAIIQEIITRIRTMRSEFSIARSQKFALAIRFEEIHHDISYIREHQAIIQSLCGLSDLKFISIHDTNIILDDSVTIIGNNYEIYAHIKHLIDVVAIKTILEKQLKKAEKQIIHIKNRLNDEQFIKRAKSEVIEKDTKLYTELEELIQKNKNYMYNLHEKK